MWMNTQIIALNTTQTTYYTPWFPRGADNAVFTMEKIQDTFGTSALAVTVCTKNVEDEGSEPSTAGTFAVLTGNFWQVTSTGLKELVRFKLVFTASAAGQGVVFRFLPTTWYDTAV